MKLKINLPSHAGNRGGGVGSSAGTSNGLGAAASGSSEPAAARPKRAQSHASLDDGDEVVFVSEGVEAAAAPAKPKRSRKRVKLEQTASAVDREDDAQDAADELMAPPGSGGQGGAQEARTQAQQQGVARALGSCLPSFVTHTRLAEQLGLIALT